MILERLKRVMERTDRYAEQVDEFVLMASENPLFRFTRLNSTGLENRRWVIASYFDGRRLISPRKFFQRGPELLFIAGRVDGNTGCDTFTGPYTLTDGRLESHPETSLFGWGYSCNRVIEGQHAPIERALSGRRTVQQDGDRIVLRDEAGQVQAILAPWPS